MELDSVRPVIGGLIGGLIATWLTSRRSRRLPSTYNSKPREYLLQQHRLAIGVANALFIAGLFFGVALYSIGSFANTDHRPLLWGFGLASVLPLVALGLISSMSGRDVREAYVAFSWGQGTPLWAT